MKEWELDAIDALCYLIRDARCYQQRYTEEAEDLLRNSIEKCLVAMDVTPTDEIIQEVLDA